jgi:hypothetical protein
MEKKTWGRSDKPKSLNAKYCMNKRIGSMKNYWQHALTVAKRLNQIDGVKTIPEVPVCNMFHVYFDASKEIVESIFAKIIEKHNIVLAANIRDIDGSCCKSELSFGDSFNLIPQVLLDEAFDQFDLEFKKFQTI